MTWYIVYYFTDGWNGDRVRKMNIVQTWDLPTAVYRTKQWVVDNNPDVILDFVVIESVINCGTQEPMIEYFRK